MKKKNDTKNMRNVRVSGEMARKTDTATLFARVTREEHALIMGKIKAAGGKQQQFVYDAVMEKLTKAGIETTDVGPLANLPPDDRRRAEKFIAFLRTAPEHFKRAGDMGMELIELTMQEFKEGI